MCLGNESVCSNIVFDCLGPDASDFDVTSECMYVWWQLAPSWIAS